jgi:hypothetical protein
MVNVVHGALQGSRAHFTRAQRVVLMFLENQR